MTELPALLTAELLPGFGITLNLSSESHGTHNYIFLSDGFGGLPDAIPGLPLLNPVLQPRAGLPSKDRL
jgi:hypothetical protein